MAEDRELVREGDHVVFTGNVDESSGGHEAVVYHEDGTTHDVVSLKDKAPGQEVHTQRCQEFPGMDNVHHVVGIGTGRRGPALANCSAFRDQIVKMFGEHRLDPSRRDERD